MKELGLWQVSYRIGFVLAVLVLTFGLSTFFSRLIRRYCEVNISFKPISGVIIFFMNLLLYPVALLLILDNLGVQIGPLLASLGISGLAVSLALVDVLKDLFAGIYIVSDKVINVSDKVILGSGEEGEILEIRWRNVLLRKESGETIIIPNQKFYQASITVKNS